MRRIGGRVSFMNSDDVDRRQQMEYADAYVAAGQPKPILDTNVDRVLVGERNAWLPVISAQANPDMARFADGLRADRAKLDDAMQELVAQWNKENPAFVDVLAEEWRRVGKSTGTGISAIREADLAMALRPTGAESPNSLLPLWKSTVAQKQSKNPIRSDVRLGPVAEVLVHWSRQRASEFMRGEGLWKTRTATRLVVLAGANRARIAAKIRQEEDMARRAEPPAPEPPKLSPEKAVRRLEQRIAELEALDCAAVSDYDGPELRTLRSAILTTLEDAFGQNSREYHRYSDAGFFRQSRVINMGGGFGRGARGPDVRQVREDCANAKVKNVALLRAAVQVLVERMEDEVGHRPTAQAQPVFKERPPVMHFHNVHNITGNVGVGNTSGAISSIGDVRGLNECLSELKKYEGQLAKLSGLADLADKLRNVENELAKPSPDQWRVAEILTDIRNALSGAAGNMLAAGAAALIQRAIGG